MGRIVVHENVTLDGVIQDPTGDEGFEFGGWFDQMPDETRQVWGALEYQEALDASAWLIGRGTYLWFAARWAEREGAWADRLRAMPKYVVSSTLDAADEWANSIVVGGDAVDAAATLRKTVDGDVMVYASAPLVRTLLNEDLVDELRLMTHPFVFGTGERLFRGIDAGKSLRFVDARTVGKSLALLTYEPVR